MASFPRKRESPLIVLSQPCRTRSRLTKSAVESRGNRDLVRNHFPRNAKGRPASRPEQCLNNDTLEWRPGTPGPGRMQVFANLI
jgi:hypothetical protein